MAGVGTRILTVEDDERIRTAVKLALEDEGWTVDEAGSGEEAIELFRRTPPDVVLIDIMLPGIDGFELCRHLRKTSDVPIVMVTARVDTHDVVAGLEAGADDYLTKPFAPKELSARIRALLRRIRPMGPAHARLVFGDLEIIADEGKVLLAGEELHLTKPSSACWSNWPRAPDASSAASCSSTKCGATTISATDDSSTCTFVACAPRSKPTQQTLVTWSRFEDWATDSSRDRNTASPGPRHAADAIG